MPSSDPSRIAAGQRPLWPDDLSRPQRVSITFGVSGVFPMTHHVECVALLAKN